MKIGSVLGNYLKADDIGTTRPVVTIDRVEVFEIDDKARPVMHFVGKHKGLKQAHRPINTEGTAISEAGSARARRCTAAPAFC